MVSWPLRQLPLGGGCLTEVQRKAKPPSPALRRTPGFNQVVMALGPAGNICAALAIHYHAHVAIVLVTVGIATFGALFYFPALFSYMSTVRQSAPATPTAGVQSIMSVSAGAVVVVGAIARSWLGYGWWLTMLALLQVSVGAFAGVVIYQQQASAVRRFGMVPGQPQQQHS